MNYVNIGTGNAPTGQGNTSVVSTISQSGGLFLGTADWQIGKFNSNSVQSTRVVYISINESDYIYLPTGSTGVIVQPPGNAVLSNLSVGYSGGNLTVHAQAFTDITFPANAAPSNFYYNAVLSNACVTGSIVFIVY